MTHVFGAGYGDGVVIVVLMMMMVKTIVITHPGRHLANSRLIVPAQTSAIASCC